MNALARPRPAVTVVGLGDDGCASLSARAANAVARAEVLVGGERHLAWFPQFSGERIVLKGPLEPTLARVAKLADEHTVCVLASGDPLFFGVGARIARLVGGAHVEFLPVPSSVQWACARTGIAWDDAEMMSVHGRPIEGVVVRLRGMHKVAILTDKHHNAARLAQHLLDYGEHAWDAWVCERLGGPGERVRRFTLERLAVLEDLDALHVVLLVRSDPDWRPPASVPFAREEDFAKRTPKVGLITKREVRALSLAILAIRPDAVVWDVGAGSGAVAVEAAMLAPRGRVFAIEVDPEGVALCRHNARSFGTDNVHVVAGRAPEAFAGLDVPDAVFIGGTKGSMADIVAAAFATLREGGRLVINVVTLENISEAYAALCACGVDPELTLVQVSRGARFARYQRYEALNPVHVFAVEKPAAQGLGRAESR